MWWRHSDSDRELMNRLKKKESWGRAIRIGMFCTLLLLLSITAIFLFLSWAIFTTKEWSIFTFTTKEIEPFLTSWVLGAFTGSYLLATFFFTVLFCWHEPKIRRQHRLLVAYSHRLDELGELNEGGQIRPRT